MADHDDRSKQVLAVRRMLFSKTVWIADDEIATAQPGMSTMSNQLKNWEQSGKIFSVIYDDAKYYAAYQFDGAGRPLEVVRDILTTLGPDISPWGVAAWFHLPNQWVNTGSDRPMSPKDMLHMPHEVLLAATKYRGTYIA